MGLFTGQNHNLLAKEQKHRIIHGHLSDLLVSFNDVTFDCKSTENCDAKQKVKIINDHQSGKNICDHFVLSISELKKKHVNCHELSRKVIN